jgi:hypothetical protein
MSKYTPTPTHTPKILESNILPTWSPEKTEEMPTNKLLN